MYALFLSLSVYICQFCFYKQDPTTESKMAILYFYFILDGWLSPSWFYLLEERKIKQNA